MERRYLVTTLAILATFTTFSSGFRSLQHFSLDGQHPSILSRLAGKVKSQFHPSYPEEAQLLAEMNLPLVAAQATIAEQAAKRSEAAAQCARATAMREAERAQREAIRMSAEAAHEASISVAPMVIDLKGLDGLDQRMQARAAAMAERAAARNVRMQLAVARVQAVSMQMQNSRAHKSPCRSREIQ